MELHWDFGTGPATTQELADLVEKEGRLITGDFLTRSGQRCLWGVIGGYVKVAPETDKYFYIRTRRMAAADWSVLVCAPINLSSANSDAFVGTPEERCDDAVCRLRAIP